MFKKLFPYFFGLQLSKSFFHFCQSMFIWHFGKLQYLYMNRSINRESPNNKNIRTVNQAIFRVSSKNVIYLSVVVVDVVVVYGERENVMFAVAERSPLSSTLTGSEKVLPLAKFVRSAVT